MCCLFGLCPFERRGKVPSPHCPPFVRMGPKVIKTMPKYGGHLTDKGLPQGCNLWAAPNSTICNWPPRLRTKFSQSWHKIAVKGIAQDDWESSMISSLCIRCDEFHNKDCNPTHRYARIGIVLNPQLLSKGLFICMWGRDIPEQQIIKNIFNASKLFWRE